MLSLRCMTITACGLVGLVLCFGGCGGRAVPTFQEGGPGANKDGAWITDGGVVAWDHGILRRDANTIAWDSRLPRDAPVGDSCLPIPAKAVQGSYAGKWKGTWSCPAIGQNMAVSGSLQFTLTPAGSPESFYVKGSMSGYVEPGIPFSSTITGTMGCTSLSASLPNIIIGSGGVIAQLKGAMTGVFTALPKQGFPSGSWNAQEKGGSCKAFGVWQAFH